jgi:diazepam-binding inhibitor (GABA receptor modulating acyl-CoA-binding protein)
LFLRRSQDAMHSRALLLTARPSHVARCCCAAAARRAVSSASATPTTDVAAKFEAVSRRVGPRIAATGSADEKLRAYALYKQVTAGDAPSARPSMLDFVARAKHDAWAELRGLAREEAMSRYVAEFGSAGAC